jgi:hypothetical protein
MDVLGCGAIGCARWTEFVPEAASECGNGAKDVNKDDASPGAADTIRRSNRDEPTPGERRVGNETMHGL